TSDIFSGVPQEITDNSLFKIGDKLVKLYGIISPKDEDECQDEKGNKKSCKEESKKSLLSKIADKEISCTPKGNGNGFQLATCTIDGEDIASYLIKNGLGFSDSENTNTYDEDEKEARKKGKGIWKKVKKNDFFKDLKKKWKNLF
ncbi:MAG: thermonuclease family protein, partial [Alphaproteobacteria bacterium]|nr:thermonuclease family protein [Alphaproteobacteria bacterium]